MNFIKKLLVVAFFAISGCSEEMATSQMPEVNNESCKPENIMALEPESLRREFASNCFRENPFKPSQSPKSWGDI